MPFLLDPSDGICVFGDGNGMIVIQQIGSDGNVKAAVQLTINQFQSVFESFADDLIDEALNPVSCNKMTREDYRAIIEPILDESFGKKNKIKNDKPNER